MPVFTKRRNNMRTRSVKWTLTSRLQVIKAVIKVEGEIMTMGKNCGASRNRWTKWERILKLLPPALRVKGSRNYKCQHRFQSLVQTYRMRQKSKGRRSGPVKSLTEAECALLKKRDELHRTWVSPGAANGLRSRSSDGSGSGSLSSNHQAQPTPTSNGSLNSSSNQGHWSEGFMGTETGGRAAESAEEASLSDNRAEEMERSHFDGKQGTDADTSLGDASRFSSGPQDSHKKTRLPSSFRRSARRSPSESQEPENRTPEPRTRAQYRAQMSPSESQEPENRTPEPRTRAQYRAQMQARTHSQNNSYSAVTGHSNSPRASRSERNAGHSNSPRASRSERNAVSYRTGKGSDERYRTLLDGSIRRLDLGFSELGTWVHTRLIPEARKVMDEMTGSASTSAKRRKVRHPAQGAAAEPFNDLLQMNLKGMIDNQIRASLQKLRIRFTTEVKNTSVELSRDLLQAIQIGYVSR